MADKDKRSLMERMLAGDVVIGFGKEHEYAVKLNSTEVWVWGCDCSARMNEQEVAEVYEALGTYLRIQRNQQKKGKA